MKIELRKITVRELGNLTFVHPTNESLFMMIKKEML